VIEKAEAVVHLIIDDCFTPNKTFSEFRAGRHSVTIEHVLNVDAAMP
jgi:hypothetical protein